MQNGIVALLAIIGFCFIFGGLTILMCAAPFLLVAGGLYLVWRLLDLLFGGRHT